MSSRDRRRIFLLEYVVGGGFCDIPEADIPSSLLTEGTAMWRSVLADLTSFFDVATTVDDRWRDLASVSMKNLLTIVSASTVTSLGDRHSQWMDRAGDSDLIVVIAPESDAIHSKLVAELRTSGTIVWSPQQRWLDIFADKAQTETWLRASNIPTIGHPGCQTDGWIVKPLDGCGSERVRWFSSELSTRRHLGEGLLRQPHHVGTAVSVLVMTSTKGRRTVLPAVGQLIEWLDTSEPTGSSAALKYVGGFGPLASDLQQRASNLVHRCLAALPPTQTQGFLGFDLILGAEPDADVIVEINPRLTTSYVGYRHMYPIDLEASLFGNPTDQSVEFSVKDFGGRSCRWSIDGAVIIDGQPLNDDRTQLRSFDQQ